MIYRGLTHFKAIATCAAFHCEYIEFVVSQEKNNNI